MFTSSLHLFTHNMRSVSTSKSGNDPDRNPLGLARATQPMRQLGATVLPDASKKIKKHLTRETGFRIMYIMAGVDVMVDEVKEGSLQGDSEKIFGGPMTSGGPRFYEKILCTIKLYNNDTMECTPGLSTEEPEGEPKHECERGWPHACVNRRGAAQTTSEEPAVCERVARNGRRVRAKRSSSSRTHGLRASNERAARTHATRPRARAHTLSHHAFPILLMRSRLPRLSVDCPNPHPPPSPQTNTTPPSPPPTLSTSAKPTAPS